MHELMHVLLHVQMPKENPACREGVTHYALISTLEVWEAG
jgi:hypothetical protein